jgi:phenylalanyl-tRNA synthetase beta chain
MKISKKWLENYVPINQSNEDLAAKLSMSGTCVESFSQAIDDKVIVAEILHIKKHPDADRLQIATVSDGKDSLQIVCGATNIKVGQKVPLATIGAILSGGEIKKTSIRGVESFGMLCAPNELSISDDHLGIMILPDEYIAGKPLRDYLGNDTVFETEITPNRGDCLSHFGIAREIAALDNLSIKKDPISLNLNLEKAISAIKVEVSDSRLCPQYMARVVKNVKIGPSPKWLIDHLTSVGINPINNIVDVTNFILFDLGQPLHAFDLHKISDQKIIVRKARKGENITTLDGKSTILDQDMLVIADAKAPIAIAGVMGGANSEVDCETKDIVIESAEFDMASIRKTSKKLGLSTDASYRFERGIDSGSIEYALNKAAKLMAEVGQGNVLDGIVKVGSRQEPSKIKIEYSKINKLLGLELKDELMRHILKSLGFVIDNDYAVIPLWRKDIFSWHDLAEEIGRIYGYDMIKSLAVPKTAKPSKSDYYKEEKIKDILIALGFVEVYNYPFLSNNDINIVNLKAKNLLEVANPIQPENKYLRNSLLPNLLKVIAKNPTFDPVLVFELGHIFEKSSEALSLTLVTAGKNSDTYISNALEDLKKVALSASLPIEKISQDILDKFKIRKASVSVATLSLVGLHKLLQHDQEIKKSNPNYVQHYRPISKYPAMVRDLAFILDKKVNIYEIRDCILSVSNQIYIVELFDEFTSDKLGKNMKNVAFHLYLQNMDKTMTDEETSTIIKKVINKVESVFKAKLRA